MFRFAFLTSLAVQLVSCGVLSQSNVKSEERNSAPTFYVFEATDITALRKEDSLEAKVAQCALKKGDLVIVEEDVKELDDFYQVQLSRKLKNCLFNKGFLDKQFFKIKKAEYIFVTPRSQLKDESGKSVNFTYAKNKPLATKELLQQELKLPVAERSCRIEKDEKLILLGPLAESRGGHTQVEVIRNIHDCPLNSFYLVTKDFEGLSPLADHAELAELYDAQLGRTLGNAIRTFKTSTTDCGVNGENEQKDFECIRTILSKAKTRANKSMWPVGEFQELGEGGIPLSFAKNFRPAKHSEIMGLTSVLETLKSPKQAPEGTVVVWEKCLDSNVKETGKIGIVSTSPTNGEKEVCADYCVKLENMCKQGQVVGMYMPSSKIKLSTKPSSAEKTEAD